MRRTFVVFSAALALLVAHARGADAAAAVLTKKENCTNAYAVLGWSTFTTEEQHKLPWSKIGWILGRRTWLTQVETIEPGVVRQLAFFDYRVKGNPKAHAYVAQCGHGGTCNEVADVFSRIYHGIGVAQVECGALPGILVEPSRPEIPIASAEEIATADADALEEMSEDEDDDDEDEDEDADEDEDDDDDEKPKKKSKKSDDEDDDD